jgi:predicted AAA+ superfamily ATPase
VEWRGGRVFEPAVRLVLSERYSELFYWREKNLKVDFVREIALMRVNTTEAKSSERLEVEKLSAFETKYRAWLHQENARFELEGLWCDDLKVC